MIPLFLITLFPFCLIFAAISDILTMTIPNRICLLLIAGFPCAAYLIGMSIPDIALFAGFGLCIFLLGFCLFASGLVGGGDAKLLAASAFWIGPNDAIPYIVIATGLGAVLALGLLYARSICVPVTGYAFADRLLSQKTGVPYGVALSVAGLIVYADGPFVTAALHMM